MNLQKSATERFLHALIFEVLAIAICAPMGAWLLGHSLAHMGALTLMISLLAMSWNRTYALTTAVNCGLRCSVPGMNFLTKSPTTAVNNWRFHW